MQLSGVKANYDAIRDVFERIQIDFAGQRIGCPMIDEGLAGGDRETIAAIINEKVNGEDHTVVVFQPFVSFSCRDLSQPPISPIACCGGVRLRF